MSDDNFRVHDTTGSFELSFTKHCPFWDQYDDTCNIKKERKCYGVTTPPDDCILKTKQIIITHVGED